LGLWQRWEPIAMWLWRVRAVQAGAVLQFGVSPYRGASTELADGTPVPNGATILHLHLDNRRVTEAIRSSRGNVWALVPRINADLDALAELVLAGSLGPVAALRGITVLAGMAGRFGFEVRPLPRNLRWRLVHTLGGLVLASYQPDKTRSLEQGLPWPGEIWMSTATLTLRTRLHPNREP
jgi:hypothetical protein